MIVGVFHRGTAMEVNFAVKDVVTNPAVKDSADPQDPLALSEDLRLVPTISSITKTGISTRRRSCQLDLFSIFSFYVIFQNFRFNELIYYEWQQQNEIVYQPPLRHRFVPSNELQFSDTLRNEMAKTKKKKYIVTRQDIFFIFFSYFIGPSPASSSSYVCICNILWCIMQSRVNKLLT